MHAIETSSPAAPPRASPRGGALAVVAAAALLYGAAGVASPPLVGLYHDDGVYVGSALSLAQGEGYRVRHLPGRPPQTKYPPLYPLLLTPVAAWSGGDPARLGAFRWPSLLATLGALALLPGLMRRWGLAPRAALAATAATAFSPLVFQHGLQALSEASYLLLTLAALRLLPARGRPAGRARFAAAGACAAGAVLTRSIGVALLPALALAAWSRRREPRAWLPLAAGVAAFAGWSLAAAAARGDADWHPLYAYYLDYGAWLHPSFAAALRVATANLRAALLAAGDSVPGLRVLAVPHWQAPAAALGIAAVFGWLRLARRAPAETSYLATTFALVLLFPFDVTRYFVPLTPFVAASLWAAAGALHRRLRAPHFVAPAAAALLLAVCLGGDLARFPTSARLPLLDRSLPAPAFEAAAAWLRQHAAPGDVVVSEHDPWVHLATGLGAIPPGVYDPLWRYADESDAIDPVALWNVAWSGARELGARWVLVSEHWHPIFRALWRQQLASRPDLFPLRFSRDGIQIYEIARRAGPQAAQRGEAERRPAGYGATMSLP